MKRAVAAALIGLILAETPSCGESRGGGSGDLNHPNVKPLSSGAPGPNQRDYGKKGKNERPTPSPTRWDVVVFEVGLTPPRNVTITWQINGKGASTNGRYGQWSLARDAKTGDTATLMVENLSEGGRTHCMIRVNGKMPIPPDGAAWDPYMHRNDHGDCKATLVVP